MGKQLVLAYFENEASADQAVDAVKQWDKASKEIKLGAIGILVKDDKGKIKTHKLGKIKTHKLGKIKTHKLGKRKTGTGAVIFALAAALTGGHHCSPAHYLVALSALSSARGWGCLRTTWPVSTANWTAARRLCVSSLPLTRRQPLRPN